MTKCPLYHTKVLTRGAHKMTFQISPRVHLSSVTKCPLHHPKVLMQGACEMTFQISPRIHLAWPSVPFTTQKFSREVDARWLFKCHLTSMWDDIRKVFKEKFLQSFLIWPWDIEEVTSNSKVLTRGAHKMSFQISACIHLVWPSVPSTTPKFSCEVHMRWLSNLTSHPFSVTKCPLNHTKVLTQGAHKMTFQISPHIHLVWQIVSSTTPKFSREVHVRWLFKSHLASI